MELGRDLEPDGGLGSSAELADILQRYGFDAETCDEIANMGFPEAYDFAHECLSEVDFDADQILAHYTTEPLEED